MDTYAGVVLRAASEDWCASDSTEDGLGDGIDLFVTSDFLSVVLYNFQPTMVSCLSGSNFLYTSSMKTFLKENHC